MIPQIGVNQETIENVDTNDTPIPTDRIKAINETPHGRLIASRETNHQAQTDSETTRAIFLTAHAHQVVFA